VSPVDEPQAIREGEELDREALSAYLEGALPEFQGNLEILQFPSGHSNLTYCVRCGRREYVLRRPPFGSKVKSAHDMSREYEVLDALRDVFPEAPRPLSFCNDRSVMDVDFYVMERIEGMVVRHEPPAGVSYDEAMVRTCCERFMGTLARLHAVDYEAVGLGAMRREGSYVERQITGWTKRYHGSQTDDIVDMDATAAWLAAHMPEDCGSVLVHNDFKFDNVVWDGVDPTRLIGVLDWEMATIGDPMMDLGTSLSYWIEADEELSLQPVQCFLTSSPGSPTRRELAALYSELTGRDTSRMHFYYIYGLFKLAVIVQQIYYRYAQGLTKDSRFAIMIEIVKLLGRKATATIESETI
jgi:aminoglycoside phosphotransferase (APT) family kinase protein